MDELNIHHREFCDQEYNFYQAFSRVNLDNILSVPRNFDKSRIKGLAINLMKVTNMDFVCSIEKVSLLVILDVVELYIVGCWWQTLSACC